MNVLLVSTCPNIATAYAGLLREYDGMGDVHVATTIPSLLSIMREHPIDMICSSEEILKHMDDVIPILDATDVRRPKTVLVLQHVSGKVIVEAIRHGFNDVIDLAQSGEAIVARLRNVVSGDIDLSTQSYVEGIRGMLGRDNRCRFANDETDLLILAELANGHSNKEIAESVYLSLQTVRNRISRLMQATEAHNRTQLALMFIQD